MVGNSAFWALVSCCGFVDLHCCGFLGFTFGLLPYSSWLWVWIASFGLFVSGRFADVCSFVVFWFSLVEISGRDWLIFEFWWCGFTVRRCLWVFGLTLLGLVLILFVGVGGRWCGLFGLAWWFLAVLGGQCAISF